MNKEDYVSLEVAKKLEEKGFNEPCDSRHIVYEDGRYKFERYKTFDISKDIGIVKIKDGCFYDSYLAPTLYEAAKWLRNEHDINVSVATAIPMWFDRIPDSGDTLYVPFITYKKEDGKTEVTILRNLKDFNYEKVYNDGILEALKLI